MIFFDEEDRYSLDLEKSVRTQLSEICHSYQRKWRKDTDHLIKELKNKVAEKEKCDVVETTLKTSKAAADQVLLNIGNLETSCEKISEKINITDNIIQNTLREEQRFREQLTKLELKNSEFNNLLSALKSRVHLFELAFDCSLTYETPNIFKFSFLSRGTEIGSVVFEFMTTDNQFIVKDYQPAGEHSRSLIRELELDDTQSLMYHFRRILT